MYILSIYLFTEIYISFQYLEPEGLFKTRFRHRGPPEHTEGSADESGAAPNYGSVRAILIVLSIDIYKCTQVYYIYIHTLSITLYLLCFLWQIEGPAQLNTV